MAIEVKSSGPVLETVHLKWPSNRPIEVRSLSGSLRVPDYIPGQPQPGLSLEVLDGPSGRVLKSGQTDDKGNFSFGDMIPGLYFLNVKPSGVAAWGAPLAGWIVAEVSPRAPSDRLDLDLGWSSCGLSYADQAQCPRPDLAIHGLAGEVVDAMGAMIPGAVIFLSDERQTVVEQFQSDRSGRFISPRPLSGTYQLFIRAPGFAPFRRTVHVESTAGAGGLSSLVVRLSIALGTGGCSTAEVQ